MKLEITKSQLKDPCKGCGLPGHGATCCNYVVVTTEEYLDGTVDFDYIYWLLTRDGFMVEYDVQKKPSLKVKDWTIYFKQRCKFLGEDNRCRIYDIRSEVCSDYMPFPVIGEDYGEEDDFCERYDNNAKDVITFTDPLEFRKFVIETFKFDWLDNRKSSKIDKTTLKIKKDKK